MLRMSAGHLILLLDIHQKTFDESRSLRSAKFLKADLRDLVGVKVIKVVDAGYEITSEGREMVKAVTDVIAYQMALLRDKSLQGSGE